MYVAPRQRALRLRGQGAMMIRVRPFALVIAIIFIVFGPHNWWIAGSNRVSQPPPQPTALSWILPDAASFGDRPRRGGIDAIQTKQGWMVRIASRGQLLGDLFVMAVVFAFYWPLRQKALARKQDEPDSAVENDDS
jgi:hypothetical protein